MGAVVSKREEKDHWVRGSLEYDKTVIAVNRDKPWGNLKKISLPPPTPWLMVAYRAFSDYSYPQTTPILRLIPNYILSFS